MTDLPALADFWDYATDEMVNPPLTDAMLQACQELLGVTLPTEYVELLKAQNGGRFVAERCAFPTSTKTSWADDHVPFWGCNGISDGFNSITESVYLNQEWDQPSELVLLLGEGHWWVALDYRRQPSSPSVVWYDNAVGQDLQLAPSFGTFLAGLGPDPRP